ncbi:MAG: type II/IV secretion system ATPase subunit, partial [Candidatus Micrarchaeota archaeon]|nr:type II/IV secretion system ATPase subunit [Candidatus Micrarchaeota archaeon]
MKYFPFLAFRNKRVPEGRSSAISFRLLRENLTSVYEKVDFPITHTIGRSSNLNLYLVGQELGEFSTQALQKMGVAKAKVIDLMSQTCGVSLPESMERAKGIAFSDLSKSLGLELSEKLALAVAHDTAGYGPLSLLLEDKQNIEEIEINTPDSPIYIYHCRYGRCKTNLKFESEQAFRQSINKLLYDTEKELNDSTPIIDVQVGGARIHAQIRPYAVNGACATIRLGDRKESGLAYLSKKHVANFDTLAYLWLALESKMNLVISGAPASGKTTLLIALLCFVPRYSKVITIEEDVNELKFYSNVISTVSLQGSRYGNSVGTREQVINSLRMRPDLLVVGEIRGAETKELFGGANFGIPFMTTMHSNDGGISIIKRMLTRPMSVEPEAISSMDISVQMSHKDIESRQIDEMTEYRWLSRAEILGGGIQVGDDMVKLDTILTNSSINPRALAESKVIQKYSKITGVSKAKALEELRNRSEFLSKLVLQSRPTLEL